MVPRITWAITILVLSGCLGYPKAVTPVEDFEIDRYLGKWYEIARLDHSFERGLEQVSAEYALREDGGVNVVNSGYSAKAGEWREATGKAYFVTTSDRGYLKVSFFGPFYGSYVIFELDEKSYQYAFVTGPNTSYLWFLARTPVVDQDLIDHFVGRAQRLGFDTDALIFPAPAMIHSHISRVPFDTAPLKANGAPESSTTLIQP